uniref:Uncharacterized protein n=1 Tax=Panagrolaimus sp. JU765 TaxID=591449 RepID=A0AC34QX75_9BILA
MEIIEQEQIRIGSRRNAVVNQLRKTVKFPEQIKWPQSKFFTHEIGKEKIIEMIEKTWNYDPRLIYVVDFYSVIGYSAYQRYRYFVRWHSPNGNFAHVYFNIDVTRNQSEKPVNVTYTFEDGKIVHKPHTSNYHNRWLRQLIQP